MTNYSKKDVCAAFVLYNPDKDQFLRSLSSAWSAGLSVVVVDNTPSRLLKFDIVSGVTPAKIMAIKFMIEEPTESNKDGE